MLASKWGVDTLARRDLAWTKWSSCADWIDFPERPLGLRREHSVTISRGFLGRHDPRAIDLPPGQHLTHGFPVLTAGPTQQIPTKDWAFTITPETGKPQRWNWEELMALPSEDITVDIHCVTRWTKLGTQWRGVAIDTFFQDIDTNYEFAMVHSYGGYTTNLPLQELVGGKAWIVYEYDGSPLARRARRPGQAPGAASLLLEVREVGERHHDAAPRRARVLGEASAITTTETRGAKNGTPVTDAGSTEDPADSLAGAAPAPRNRWRKATLIGLHSQSRHSRTLALRVPGWPGHLPGQHVDVRLTAADGYSAQRSYSLAEPATPNRAAITVDLLPHGEVSPYLVETMEIGDELDVRGPIGGWFVWEPGDPSIGDGPVLLVAGGSGVVPLVTMLRARKQAGDRTPTMLVYSLRGPRDLMYGPELQDMSAEASQADRRVPPTCASCTPARCRRDTPVPPPILRSRIWLLRLRGRGPWRPAFTCAAPRAFVDHATDLLRQAGYPDGHIRTERFGPTGADR